MIVYGTRGKLLKTELASVSCPNCNTANSIQMNVFQRWAHVFWIPFFPIGKTGVSQCLNCRQVLKLKEMPASLRLDYDNLKAQINTPIWTFSGIGVVIVIGIFAYIHGKQNAERVKQWVLNPKPNDVYHVKLKNDHYTLYKVDHIVGDTVFLALNKYETDGEEGLSDMAAKGDTAYDLAQQGLPKSVLADMAKEDRILDIDRK